MADCFLNTLYTAILLLFWSSIRSVVFCEEIIWVICEEGEEEREIGLPADGFYKLHTAMNIIGKTKFTVLKWDGHITRKMKYKYEETRLFEWWGVIICNM
jgi:hypothetical protein